MKKDLRPIINKMTTEEKVGQLFMEYMEHKYEVLPHIKEAFAEGRIGSIIYFSGCNVEDGVQLGALSAKVLKESMKHRHGIPALLAIDQEGGQLASVRKKATLGPGNMAIGASASVKDAETMGFIAGTQLKAMNIGVNLAPVVDTASNLDVPITSNRFFGSDPKLVGQMGAAYVKGCQRAGMGACLKHFPGMGNSEKDTHWHLDVIDKPLSRLEKNEFLPFKMGIDAGAASLLTIHAIFPALDKRHPATLSDKIINGYLRKKMGFNGLIISDDVYMKAIKNNYGLDEAAYLAINAGVDIVMGAAATRSMFDYCLKKIKQGKLTMDQVNAAVERVLVYKSKYCMDIVPTPKAKKILVTKKFDDLAQKVSDHAITVVKNDEGVLPLKLKKNETVCLIQPGMVRLEMSDACNLYTENILKKEIEKYHPNVREVTIGLEPNKEEIISILDNAFISDTIIACTNHAFRYTKQAEMMKEIIKLAESKKKKLVVVALRSPSDLYMFPEANTYVATYGNWDCLMKSLVKVLFGKIKAVGKLPVPIRGLFKIGFKSVGKPKKVKKNKKSGKNYFFEKEQ